jgi:hypothetical protein
VLTEHQEVHVTVTGTPAEQMDHVGWELHYLGPNKDIAYQLSEASSGAAGDGTGAVSSFTLTAPVDGLFGIHGDCFPIGSTIPVLSAPLLHSSCVLVPSSCTTETGGGRPQLGDCIPSSSGGLFGIIGTVLNPETYVKATVCMAEVLFEPSAEAGDAWSSVANAAQQHPPFSTAVSAYNFVSGFLNGLLGTSSDSCNANGAAIAGKPFLCGNLPSIAGILTPMRDILRIILWGGVVLTLWGRITNFGKPDPNGFYADQLADHGTYHGASM